jgi:class 3 adenylate cyclase
MLFADAVGFSKLAESQIPLFVERFLGGVRSVMDRQARTPLTCNTWGDGLFFTFDSVAQASDFALDLSDFVNSVNWAGDGLPAEMSLRIALHAGPAFEILDPVTRLRCFNGSHVNRAARMEPVTPPGYVYCSEAHAALVALEHNAAYHCEFVGNLPFAKNYGVFPAYSLKRRAR